MMNSTLYYDLEAIPERPDQLSLELKDCPEENFTKFYSNY